MRRMEKMKKVWSVLLAISMVMSWVPIPTHAAQTDGLCEHHSIHTEDCGYVEAVIGADCTHEHSEDCYALLACLHSCGDECADGCAHECTVDNGCITMALDCHHIHGDCGYSEGTAEIPCGHSHDASCGYVEAVAGNPCADAETNPECDHTGDCGYVAAVEGQPCGHTEHFGCGYALASEDAPCTHTHVVKANSADSCYKLLCSHKDGGHDDACGYKEAVEGKPCTYHCDECLAHDHGEEEPSEEPVKETPVCTCGTDDAAVHATNCPVYAAPENPECHCAEKCTEANVWCDVCGVDYTACQGSDQATVYYTNPTAKEGIIYNGSP